MQNVQKRHARIARHRRRRKLYKAADIRMKGSDWRSALRDTSSVWSRTFAENREYHARAIIHSMPMPRFSKRPPATYKVFADSIMRGIWT